MNFGEKKKTKKQLKLSFHTNLPLFICLCLSKEKRKNKKKHDNDNHNWQTDFAASIAMLLSSTQLNWLWNMKQTISTSTYDYWQKTQETTRMHSRIIHIAEIILLPGNRISYGWFSCSVVRLVFLSFSCIVHSKIISYWIWVDSSVALCAIPIRFVYCTWG